MDFVWTIRQQPDIRVSQGARDGTSRGVDALSVDLSLDRRSRFAENDASIPSQLPHTAVNAHRFEEVINGREFLIEVSAVGCNRWRAHLVRLPGGSTALMPFYGATPQEAARLLSDWLARAHGAVTHSRA